MVSLNTFGFGTDASSEKSIGSRNRKLHLRRFTCTTSLIKLRTHRTTVERNTYVQLVLLAVDVELFVSAQQRVVGVLAPDVGDVLDAEHVELHALGAHGVDDEPRR